jgi:large subunit ribosomal protein L29
MAVLKTKDIREMSPEERQNRLKELKEELMHERGVAAMGGAPTSPGKIRAVRTSIARLKTITNEEGEI